MSELSCLPHGVGHSDEGVCLQLHLGPYQVLLDCGVTEADVSAAPWGSLDFAFCSHAHPDHARGLLTLHQQQPQLPIFASEVTTQLLPLNWLGQPVPSDLAQALPWRTPVEIADNLTVQLWPAGHLPGASCVLLTYSGEARCQRVFYTGDFFLSNSRLVEGLPLEELRGLKPDVLIAEGTYGTARYPHRRQQENKLANIIHQRLRVGRSIVLPVPTLGIGQDLVMLLRSHHQFTGQDLTVWVDPTVAAGCDMYLELMGYFPSSVQNFARHQPLFWDERILPRVRRIPESGEIKAEGATVVIGHHGADLSRYCRNGQPWTVLLPQAFADAIATTALSANSPAECTLEWLQGLNSELEAGQVEIEAYLLTTHCDSIGTTQLIHNLRPQHVVLVHGEPSHLADLASLEELQSRYQLHLPSRHHGVELPLGDTFIQPEAPEPAYFGEIVDTSDGITALLPDNVTLDPRWRQFADTGLVQVRWQGDNLVLRSISQRELLADQSPLPNVECCHRCRHQVRQRCWNPLSPLYGVKVTAEGYCPAYEARPVGESAEDSA